VLLFLACCVVILGVSIHDMALVVLHEECMMDFEQNPLGSWLIRRGAGDVRLFVGTKLAGTAAVGAVLFEMFLHRPRRTLTVAAFLAGCQLLLLAYLSWD